MITMKHFQRFSLIIGLLFMTIALLVSVWKYLFPFVAALAVSWLLQPSIRWLHKYMKLPKPLAILLLLFSISSILLGLTTLLLTKAIHFIQNLTNEDFSSYILIVERIYIEFINWLDTVFNYINYWLGSLSLEWRETFYKSIEETKQNAMQAGMNQLQHLLELFTGGLSSLPGSFMAFGIFLMATFFLSKDWEKIKEHTVEKLPVQLSERSNQLSKSFKRTILQMIKAHIILMIITIVMVFTGLSVIDAPHPLLIALTAGILDLIPYIGTGVIFIPWIAYLFFTDQYSLTIPLSTLYILIIITRQVIEPKVLASHFGVHPLILLAGLFLGFQLWGGYALIVSPLIIAFFKVIYSSGLLNQVWSFITK
ncbi:sporulation integral membrane protein YtvI [Halobacillus sp. Marseille-Q1614]|uniref:sporulation integral membrane protein YtvI n=1 Tax=Halobacillus sp. Marseille-Q1614 TaxID=2709134 RepID=UPI00156FEE6D|nr:sporulation integral membrane protein YtvI [Halobacillus sp. Marseille-Q1614]